MRLLVKLNLIFIVVFGLGIVASGYLARNFLIQSAREQVLQQARLMMGSALAMRSYTSKQVGPLLQAHQKEINTFLAQTVPAYAATEAFNYLRTDYPDYTYKEATLNRRTCAIAPSIGKPMSFKSSGTIPITPNSLASASGQDPEAEPS